MKEIEVRFVEAKLKEAYLKLRESSGEEKEIYQRITKAIQILKKNPEAGIKIPRRLIPKTYIQKYSIDNLWKCNLSRGWRLLYTIAQDEIRIISILLEWLDHKNYERRFGYG
jgi:Txe/YoeB family toxin of Txe-Axe toxin-antitoxin module